MKTIEKTTIGRLAQEVIALRSFMIGLAGKDSDGEYHPEFVKKTIKASREEPVGSFSNRQDFMKTLKDA